MNAITIDFTVILAVTAAITSVAVAVSWLRKGAHTMTEPYREIKKQTKKNTQEIDEIKRTLSEITADNKIMLSSIALLLKHAETGNCTGEVAKGRTELEQHLINK